MSEKKRLYLIKCAKMTESFDLEFENYEYFFPLFLNICRMKIRFFWKQKKTGVKFYNI